MKKPQKLTNSKNEKDSIKNLKDQGVRKTK